MKRGTDIFNHLDTRQPDQHVNHHMHHRALLSPVRRLPTELISEIFVYSVEGSDGSWTDRRAVLLLGQICSRWRAIAISTPELWSKLQVRFGVHNVERAATITKAWFARSGQCPLSLGLYQIDSDHWYSQSLALDTLILIATIISYYHRLQHFSLHAGQRIVRTVHTFGMCESPFPLLQSLELSLFSIEQSLLPPPAWNAFQNAPRLRSVRFNSVMDVSMVKVPWMQLTDISISGDYDECLNVIRQCPNLESGTFNFLNWRSPVVSGMHGPLLHLHLRSIRFTYHAGSGFFEGLTLPALRNIHMGCDSMTWSHTEFISLLTRSSCHISLLIVDMELPFDVFVQCLMHMPQLLELHIKRYNPSVGVGSLLRRLTLVGNEEDDLCPELRVIRLSYDLPLYSQVVMDLVNSRWKGHSSSISGRNVACLESIHLSLNRPLAELLVGLKDLRDRGFHVSATDSQGVSWFSRLA